MAKKREKTAVEIQNEQADERASKFLGEKVVNGKVEGAEDDDVADTTGDKPANDDTGTDSTGTKDESTGSGTKESAKEDKPAIDQEKLSEDTAEKTKVKLLQALQGENKEETAEKKDQYDQFLEDFEKDHGRPPTWGEAAKFIAKVAREDIKKEEEEKQKVKDEQDKANKEREQGDIKNFNVHIDGQLSELIATKKLPGVKNQQDPNDPGVVARKALFQTMLTVNQERAAQGKPLIYSIKEIYYEHYKAPNQQPAGDDAPISIGSGGMQPETNDDDYSYADIHKPTFFEFFRKK